MGAPGARPALVLVFYLQACARIEVRFQGNYMFGPIGGWFPYRVMCAGSVCSSNFIFQKYVLDLNSMILNFISLSLHNDTK